MNQRRGGGPEWFGKENPNLPVAYPFRPRLLMCAPEPTPPEMAPALAADSGSLLSRRFG
jgi:hypothetical protein